MQRSSPNTAVMLNSGVPFPPSDRGPEIGVANGRPQRGPLESGATDDPRSQLPAQPGLLRASSRAPDAPSGPPDYSAVSGSTRQLTRQILWSLRSLSSLMALGIIAGATVPLLTPLEPRFEATSLIVLQQTVGRPATLPQLVRTVFEDGPVASIVVADPAIGGDPDALIPDRLDIVIELDSIVFRVVGRSADPAAATQLAEVGATALLDQLNRSGSSLGSFAVLNPAQVPSTPSFAIAVEIQSVFGAVLGWLVAVALIVFIALLRRPTVGGPDVSTAIGWPFLGVVDMPVVTETFPGPRGVAGLGQVVRRIAEATTSRIMMVSEARLTRQRQALLVMVAVVLAPLRTTVLTAPRELHLATVEHRRGSSPPPAVDGAPPDIELIEGTGALDALDPHRVAASVVLVIHRGMRRSRLRALAGDYAKQDLLGVVILDRASRPRAARAAGTGGDVTHSSRAVTPV